MSTLKLSSIIIREVENSDLLSVFKIQILKKQMLRFYKKFEAKMRIWRHEATHAFFCTHVPSPAHFCEISNGGGFSAVFGELLLV